MKRVNIVEVAEGQYVPLPNSRHVLVGPGRLRVTRYDTGRVTGQVLEGKSQDPEVVVDHNLSRRSWGV